MQRFQAVLLTFTACWQFSQQADGPRARATPGPSSVSQKLDRNAIVCRHSNWIEDYGDLLFGENQLLPNGIPQSSYQNLTAFCASDHFGGLPESNMGAHCFREQRGDSERKRIVFSMVDGDARLYRTEEFRYICQRYCICMEENEHNRGPRHPPIATPNQAWLDQQYYRNFVITMNDEGLSADGMLGPKVVHNPYERRCSSTNRCDRDGCATVSSAKGSRGSGRGDCRCVAKWFNPSVAAFGALGCQVLSSAVGGRDLDHNEGCPCNSSYVSASCCHSQDGTVWERPERKMGVLDMALLEET